MMILKLVDVVSSTKMEGHDLKQKEERVGPSQAWDDVSFEDLDAEDAEEAKMARKKGMLR